MHPSSTDPSSTDPSSTDWTWRRPRLDRETTSFLAALEAVDPSTRVPTCPDWDAADLLWHLAEVQLFWAGIVGTRAQDDAAVQAVDDGKPPRPGTYAGLLALARSARARLLEALDEGADTDPVWTWSATDRTLGFVRRRQVHEALVHRLDAELTAGAAGPVEAQLAADGVDEVLRIYWSDLPAWAVLVPVGGAVELAATDVGRSWVVQPGRFTGTSPTSGTTYDEPVATLLDDAAPTGSAVVPVVPVARVAGSAADLDRWIWRRGGSVTASGDGAALARVAEVVEEGID